VKIILSRKGFDSASGGVPSPIFPDGSMLSLPIPDRLSHIAYGEIGGNRWATVSEAVSQLAGLPISHRAHLDPDLVHHSFPRLKGWRPIFGQVGAAEGHLRKQGVGKGDLFFFFGLFRWVERGAAGWQYVRNSRAMHVLFGWLQIAERAPVSTWPVNDRWALYHPHFAMTPRASNVLYLSSKSLRMSDGALYIAGAGVFPFFSPVLQLTAPDSERPGRWLLPAWFHPQGRASVLSYHRKPSRWSRSSSGTILSSVSRGQEFVLDCDDYPEAIDWLDELMQCASADCADSFGVPARAAADS